MKPLLLNVKQVRKLTGLSEASFKYEWDFPKPVVIRANRKLWKRDDVEKWVKKLSRISH